MTTGDKLLIFFNFAASAFAVLMLGLRIDRLQKRIDRLESEADGGRLEADE